MAMSREEKKLRIIRRNEFRTKQQLDYVDFVEDELLPEIEALRQRKLEVSAVRLELDRGDVQG